MTDPVADLLTRIRNGILARKESVDCPTSTFKKRLAEILVEEGYLTGVVESKGTGPQGVLSLSIRWDAQNRPAISGIRRVSKPGQRAYCHAEKLKKVRGGLGVAIVTTSKGVMTDRQARKLGVGGEVVCEIW